MKAGDLEGFDYTRQEDDDDDEELPDMAHYGSASRHDRSSPSSVFRNGLNLENGNGGFQLPTLRKQCSVVEEGAEDGAEKNATPNEDSHQHFNVDKAENTICMMCKDMFVREGNVENDLVNFRVFRSGPCTTKDSVTYVFFRPALSRVCLASDQLTRDFPHCALQVEYRRKPGFGNRRKALYEGTRRHYLPSRIAYGLIQCYDRQ